MELAGFPGHRDTSRLVPGVAGLVTVQVEGAAWPVLEDRPAQLELEPRALAVLPRTPDQEDAGRLRRLLKSEVKRKDNSLSG